MKSTPSEVTYQASELIFSLIQLYNIRWIFPLLAHSCIQGKDHPLYYWVSTTTYAKFPNRYHSIQSQLRCCHFSNLTVWAPDHYFKISYLKRCLLVINCHRKYHVGDLFCFVFFCKNFIEIKIHIPYNSILKHFHHSQKKHCTLQQSLSLPPVLTVSTSPGIP